MLDLDGTENKSRLGANAILACSLATAHAAARVSFLPLFRYLGRCWRQLPACSDDEHTTVASTPTTASTFREFMVMPLGFDSFRESLRAGTETFHALKKVLATKGCQRPLAMKVDLLPT